MGDRGQFEHRPRPVVKVDVGIEWRARPCTCCDESLNTTIWGIWWLWFLIADSDQRLVEPTFFGDTVRFTLADPDQATVPSEVSVATLSESQIAIANWRFAEQQWNLLLTKPCWRDAPFSTYPPVDVLLSMMALQLGFVPDDALYVDIDLDDRGFAVEMLERRRADGVTLIRPIMAMFEASLTAQGFQRPAAGMKRPSPWISAKEMEQLIDMNNRAGLGSKSIQRRKREWGAQSQIGSRDQVFRFDLDRLESLGINYPATWNAVPHNMK